MKARSRLFMTVLSLTIACSSYQPILRYQESIDSDESFVYGRFDALLNSGTTCVLHLKGLGANGADAYFAASTFGYGLNKVKPGRYKVVQVIVANGFRTTSLPLGQGAEFLSKPFQVAPGEGVYLGEHACMNVRTENYRLTKDQVKVEYRFQTMPSQMDVTTNRIIELYGQKLNGRTFRSAEVAK